MPSGQNARREFSIAREYQRHWENDTIPDFVRKVVSTVGESIGVSVPRRQAVSGEALPTAPSCREPGVKRNIFPAEFGFFSAAP